MDALAEPSNCLPVPDELDLQDLPVQGMLPTGLQGTLFRNGPNARFPRPHDHWRHGDGMIHAFTLTDGRVSYRNRWVRTARFRREREAGAPLGVLHDDQGLANISVVYHADELMALDGAHAPLAICPATLRTLGPARHGCGSADPFNALPKLDPRNGELLFFGQSSLGASSCAIRCDSIDRSGNLAWRTRFEAAGAGRIRDFAMTPNFVVIPVPPAEESLLRQQPVAGTAAPYGSIAVLRRGTDELAWTQAPARVCRVINGWEAEGRVYLDVMQHEGPTPSPPNPGSTGSRGSMPARPWRWTIEPGAGCARMIELCDIAGGFPRIDDRRAGLPFRFSTLCCRLPDAVDDGCNGLARLDHHTGAYALFAAEPQDALSEAVFVPHATEGGEDEGWLLAVLWSARQRRSELLVFEAAALEAGPIARVLLPRRIPSGLHGAWVSRDALQRTQPA